MAKHSNCWEEGVPADAIERAAAEFGMAIGPLRLMDEIGLDTTLQAGWVLAAAFPRADRLVALAGVDGEGGPLGAEVKQVQGFFDLR